MKIAIISRLPTTNLLQPLPTHQKQPSSNFISLLVSSPLTNAHHAAFFSFLFKMFFHFASWIRNFGCEWKFESVDVSRPWQKSLSITNSSWDSVEFFAAERVLSKHTAATCFHANSAELFAIARVESSHQHSNAECELSSLPPSAVTFCRDRELPQELRGSRRCKSLSFFCSFRYLIRWKLEFSTRSPAPPKTLKLNRFNCSIIPPIACQSLTSTDKSSLIVSFRLCL
jgi:hypothetical protein